MALPSEYSFGLREPTHSTSGFFPNEREAVKFLINEGLLNAYANYYNPTSWNMTGTNAFFSYDSSDQLYDLRTQYILEYAYAEKIRREFRDAMILGDGGMESWVQTLADDMANNPDDEYEIKVNVTKPAI